MAALRAPGGRMQGAEAQAMSVYIVEPTQRSRRPPGLAAAAPEGRYRGPGSAATRRAHGSCWALPSSVGRGLHGPECWALPSSVGRGLHGPECGRYRRCSASLTRAPALGTIHTGIAFVVLGA